MTQATAQTSRPATGLVRGSRWAFAVLSWLFLAAVATQVFIAGLAIFSNPARWAVHTTFVHYFEFLPVVMLVAAFTGRLSRGLRWMTALIILLVGLQYATVDAARGGGPDVIGALHPVNALVIFWAAAVCARGAWNALRRA